MARKNDGRKTVASGRKGAGAKSDTGRAGVGKRPAVASSKAAAPPAAKGVKGGAKPAAAAAPPPAKVKFRGRVPENEPLARHTTYRLGGPARYVALPAGAGDVDEGLSPRPARARTRRCHGLGYAGH